MAIVLLFVGLVLMTIPTIISTEELIPIEWSYETAMIELSDKYNVPLKKAQNIIQCESRGKPDARNYQAVVGTDIGYWQLNSYYWEEVMSDQGWDIYNPQDNLEAGFWLYSLQGDLPWGWSKFCWDKL